MCFDSYMPEKKKKSCSNTSKRRRGDMKSYFFDDCRCKVEKSMRPPFLSVSSSGFVGIFFLSPICLLVCYLFRWPRFNFSFLLAIKIYVSMFKTPSDKYQRQWSIARVKHTLNQSRYWIAITSSNALRGNSENIYI